MLHPPPDHILLAAHRAGVHAQVLNVSEADLIRARVRSLLASDAEPMWECVKGAVSLQRPDGWQLIDSFLQEKRFLLLFDKREDPRVLRFPDGTLLTPILEDCPSFEFYVADEPVRSLVAFNHHDVLVVAGEAIPWARALGAQE